MTTLTPGLIAYRAATALLAPAVPLLLRQRMLRGKEDAARIGERLGRPSVARPEGEIVWVHGASVGESVAALPLIDALKKPGRTLLVTTGTVTSAQVMAQRLPAGTIHQFAPVDTPGAVNRFLEYWRPALGLFIDSEIWPNMLVAAHRRGVRLGLINGRMTESSFKGWMRARRSAANLLSRYDLCLAQDEATARRLRALGAANVQVAGNMKADARPLPADAQALGALRDAIGGRHVLLAAQTHAGEEETILPVHDTLKRDFPDLLTIIVPRHPERGEEIGMLCGDRRFARRALGALPDADTAVYIADTIGELGLFYRVTTLAFVGGSLIPHGGQNPLEPAHLGCVVLAGPYTDNFVDAYDAIFGAQTIGRVHSSAEIIETTARIFSRPEDARTVAEAAARGAVALGGAVEKTRAAVEALLSCHAHA